MWSSELQAMNDWLTSSMNERSRPATAEKSVVKKRYKTPLKKKERGKGREGR